jgi:hypothetical protein
MITLSLRDLVRNAAAVFSKAYGAVTHQADQAGCSRQTVYQHASEVEQRLDPDRTAEVPNSTNSTPRISGFAINSPP